MKLRRGETGRMAEQPGHAVAYAVAIGEAYPEHHVAAALAVHRPRRREARKPCTKSLGGGERSRMKLGVSPGEPTTVAMLWRRLVGERREGRNLGACLAPSVENMRIDEAESRIRCERDALSRRRDSERRSLRRKSRRSREKADGVEIEMALGDFGETRQPLDEVAMLVCLHQPEMPLGQDEIGVTRDRAEDGNAERGDGVGDESHMPFAANAIEHDAADPHLRIVGGEAAHQGRRRLRLARDIDDRSEERRVGEGGGATWGEE